MKKIFTSIILLTIANIHAQYSEYYTVNQNINANVNENLNISGNINVNKNISTIDYGQLALANAQTEKNRLENLRYENEEQKRVSLEIASNPSKAFDYGYQNTFEIKGKDAKPFGFKKFTMSYRIPNNILFVNAGAGRFENVSSDNITTEIIMNAPTYNKEKIEVDIEENGKMNNIIVGQLNENMGSDSGANFVHQKDLNRATVYGIKGFKSTLIWEDFYQYTITDNYTSYNPNEGNGVMYFVKVRTYGDKDDITFEQLEGRRYYIKRLIEKVISTALVTNMKY